MCAAELDFRQHLQLLLSVAQMYHEQELSQAEIAERIGYSRSRVSRLLKEARTHDMVKVQVSHPMEQVFELERRVRHRLGFEQVCVAAGPAAREPGAVVGRLVGDLVARVGHSRSLLALSNGRGVAAVVRAMQPQHWPASVVCQMVGSFGEPDLNLLDAPELCGDLAKRLGGKHRPLPVPIVMSSAAAAETVKREEMVLTTLELAARSDIAIMGVGSVGPNTRTSALLRPYVSNAVQKELKTRGAVAHICGHHFDAHGRHLTTSLCQRTVSVEPSRLAGIKHVIVAAWGPEKVPAIHAISRAGLGLTLATDTQTAQLLLDYEA